MHLTKQYKWSNFTIMAYTNYYIACSVLNVTLNSKWLANVSYLVIVFTYFHTRAWIPDQSLSRAEGSTVTISPCVHSAHS